MQPVVSIERLWISYGPPRAVRGISFEIPRGEVFGFIGPNGAGKSSTIQVLATLPRDFEGRVEIDGLSVKRKPEAAREKIGYMPDFFGVYEDLTANEDLHFFAAAYGIDRKRRPGIVNDVLELTDLKHKLNAPVDSLSRGMRLFRRRLGLPLLAKDLTEQAARKRTYIIRAVYACLLFLIAGVTFSDVLIEQSGQRFATLGRGSDMFTKLLQLQVLGVYLFLPALASGVITQEKERDRLGLLLITRLTPRSIVIQKYLSRLVPMFTFLLLSLPRRRLPTRSAA